MGFRYLLNCLIFVIWYVGVMFGVGYVNLFEDIGILRKGFDAFYLGVGFRVSLCMVDV